MVQDRKILSQTAITSSVLTDIYTCPTGQKACTESITICNRDSNDSTFRVSVALF